MSKNEIDPDLKTAMTMAPSKEAEAESAERPQTTEVTMVNAGVPKAEKSAETPAQTEMTMMQNAPAQKPENESTRTQVAHPVSGSYGNLQPGDRIDRCVIVKKLGQGGMGSVYLARHETLGVFRAIKVLSGGLYIRGGEFIRRFIQEAKIACSINHPNIVNVLDVGDDKDRNFCYIVMEYVDGGTVRDVLKQTPRLSEVDALIIAEAVAEALQAASEQKIVHRDIKPDNIMLTRRGEVKLADLGIAKNTDENVQLTKSHVMMGTPAYLAPEQAQDAHSVDVRADIYSLGATLYEMLTGEIPYPGKNMYDILTKLVSDPVPDPRALTDTISAPTARLVMRMLAKQARQRPASAAELLKEIRSLHVVPADLDKEKSIRELLVQSGAGNYSGTASTSMGGNSITSRLFHYILLKLNLFLRKLPFVSAWLDAMRRNALIFYGSISVAALVLIGIPLVLYWDLGSSGRDSALKPGIRQSADESAETIPEGTRSSSETTSAAQISPEKTSSSAESDPPPVESPGSGAEEAQKQTSVKEREKEQTANREEELRKEAERRKEEELRREAERRKKEELRREAERRKEAERKRIEAARKLKKNQAANLSAVKNRIAFFAEITPVGAEAVLRQENGREISRQTVSDNGRIRFQVLPGQYKLVVSAPGCKTEERTFPVSESRTISCVKIDLSREMTRCTLLFCGSAKLLNFLQKEGVELRIDGKREKVIKFPYQCELSRRSHRIEVAGKGIQTLQQTVQIAPDQTTAQLEFYLTEKEAVLEIFSDIREKIEINLFGIWEPMKKRVAVQPFRPVALKWRIPGETAEETIPIPELMPESVHKVTLVRKNAAAVPGKAEFAEAEKLLKGGSGRAAVEKLKLAEKAGHPEAAFRLGELAEEGIGRWFSSDEDALTAYKRAAAPPFNHPKAQLKLGIFYEQGRGGLDRDLKNAFKWYKKAAEQKNPEALYRLGVACKNGEGDEPVDHEKMMKYFTRAAELGHAEAQYQTGYGYENGIGVPINVTKAKAWYRKAAEQGHVNARNRGKGLD